MKKRNIYILLVLTFCFQIAGVQTSWGQAPVEKTLLWEISGNGLTQSSYLFGTIHILCPEELQFSKVLTEKLNASKKLVLELDLSDASLQGQLMAGAMMDNDTSIAHFFEESTYEILEKNFQILTGIPLAMVSKMKPMMLNSLLIVPMLGCTPSGWETELLKQANTHSMPVKGLETVEEQLSLFDAVPYRLQAQQLNESLLRQDSLRASLHDLLEVYRQQDIAKMVDMIEGDNTLKEISSKLLDDRNHRWIPKLEKEVQSQPTFIAVGAGHLGGQKGVISLLRKAGYTLSPLEHQN